jgi:hypothetical protein
MMFLFLQQHPVQRNNKHNHHYHLRCSCVVRSTVSPEEPNSVFCRKHKELITGTAKPMLTTGILHALVT